MYQHKVQYYETDKMGIAHHSNYIRWMEEARIDFLDQIGFGFDRLEKEGIISPVVSVNCNYRRSTQFSEVIDIEVNIAEFKGVKLKLEYIMKNADGKVVCEAESVHCFLDEHGMPIRLERRFPDFYAVLTEYM